MRVEDAPDEISKRQDILDAVVTDTTPDRNEFKILRKAANQNDLPLILYTPHFDQKVKEMALTVNADDYLFGSTAYTFASRIKFIGKIRKLKIQWIKQEQEHENETKKEKDTQAHAWQLSMRRLTDIILSSMALILASPVFLIVAIAMEVEPWAKQLLSDNPGEGIASRIFNWYQLVALAIISPILFIISIPSKVGNSEGFLFSKSREAGHGNRNYNQYKFKTEPVDSTQSMREGNTSVSRFLLKTGLVDLPQLINVLKGDISLLNRSPLTISEITGKEFSEDANHFLV
ncbi:hypothetical protein WSM22_41010 [Cytophagales bacterium WSM2-2]|nr:hypothetical protein WSM22_41010 [Cytophagales bacterium WSM2-2]